MSPDAVETSDDAPDIRRLTFDLDVEVCVIGGGLAGLITAIEAAQLGANVALLESRRIGWGASGYQIGTVMPGFDVAPQAVIARIGRRAASELWRMSQTGAEIVRALAAPIPDIALTEGALKVAASGAGLRRLADDLSLGADFGLEAEEWDRARLRETVKSERYVGALHVRRAFQINAAVYVQGLVALARKLGVRLFESTPVIALDVSGTRKRISTPSAMLRASHVVLAGNVHLGTALPRLSKTLLPVWRYGAITEPLGAVAADTIAFAGSVVDTDLIDHFRLVGDRLMWSSPQTTWEVQPARFARQIKRRIRTVFPALQDIRIAETFAGAVGCTVHGMPQIGQIRPGLWVASGFGRQGLNTTAMAGRVIARGILHGDDRWKLFGPFDLIWAGGRAGQVAGFAIEWAARREAAVGAAWTRHGQASGTEGRVRAVRNAAVMKQPDTVQETGLVSQMADAEALNGAETEAIGTRDDLVAARDAIAVHPSAALPPSPFLDVATVGVLASQESEREKPPAA